MITSKILVSVLLLCFFLFLLAINQRNLRFKSSRSESTTKTDRIEKDWQLTLKYRDGTFKKTMTFKKQFLIVGFTFQWGKQMFIVTDVEEKDKTIEITAKEYES